MTKTVLTSAILGLFGVSIALLCSELVVRALGLSPTVFHLAPDREESAYQLSDNPVLGYELKKNFRSSSTDCHHSLPYTNAWGQRDKERSLAAQGNRRILVLGDSVVAGHGVCNLRETLPAQMETLLEGDGFEVLNFGVGGYCTRGEVELLRTKGMQFKPDLVVLFFVFNDYVDRNGHVLEGLARKRPRPVEALFVRSALFRLTVLATDAWGFAEEFELKRSHTQAVGDDNISEGLALLRQLQRAHGFDVLIALWPFFDDLSVRDPYPDPVRGASGELPIERMVNEHGFRIIKLAPAFNADFVLRVREARKRRRVSPRWLYTIGDGTHPSPAGAAIAARVLSDDIRTTAR